MRTNTWINDLLKKNGITQKELANRVGLSPTVLSNKLRCKREFLYSEVVHICIELGITNPLPLFQTKKIERDAATSRPGGENMKEMRREKKADETTSEGVSVMRIPKDKQVPCSNCSSIVNKTWNFCTYCGCKIS